MLKKEIESYVPNMLDVPDQYFEGVCGHENWSGRTFGKEQVSVKTFRHLLLKIHLKRLGKLHVLARDDLTFLVRTVHMHN